MKHEVSLDGLWDLYFGDEDGSVICNAAQATDKGFRHIPASVPGNVELDLFRAGL